jgi:hypothetical protein
MTAAPHAAPHAAPPAPQLNRDKVALENQLEAEQEYITHKLQKQVAQLAGEKAALQRERSELQRQVRAGGPSCPAFPPSAAEEARSSQALLLLALQPRRERQPLLRGLRRLLPQHAARRHAVR